MPALAGNSLNETKEYNPRTAEMSVGGTTLIDAAQIGISSSKDHGQTNSLDNNGIWVDNVPRPTATAAVHATSDNIDTIKAMYTSSETFDLTFTPSEDSGESSTDITGCRVQSYDRDAVEIDSMPMMTFEIAGFDES